MISYTSTATAGAASGDSTYNGSGSSSGAGNLSSYSSYRSTNASGATEGITTYQSGPVGGGTATLSGKSLYATYNNWSDSSSSSSGFESQTSSTQTPTTFTHTASTSSHRTFTASAQTTATSYSTGYTFRTTATTIEADIYTTSAGLPFAVYTSTSTAYTSNSYVSFSTTYLTTSTTSISSHVGGLVSNTVIIPQVGEIVWIGTSTASTTGSLGSLASSYTDSFTLFYSDHTTSTSYSYHTSTGTFSYHSVLTRAATTTSAFTIIDIGTTSALAASAHQAFIGDFSLANQTEYYQSLSTGSATGTIASVTQNYFSASSYSVTTSKQSTFSSITLVSSTNDALLLDDAGTDTDDYPQIVQRGSSTHAYTAVYSVTTTASAFTEASNYTSSGATSDHMTAGTTHVGITLHSLKTDYATSANTHFVPTVGPGFASFGTAGEQAGIFLNVSADMDGGLADYYFALSGITANVQEQSVGGIFTQAQPFTLDCFSTDSGMTDDMPLFATAQFSTTTSTEVFTGTSARLAITVAQLTSYDTAEHYASTTGQITLELNSASVRSGHATTDEAFGARLAISGISMTRQAATGHRLFTMLDNSGGTSTGTTYRTAFETTVIPTNQLWIESIRNILTDNTVSIFGDGTVFTTPLLESNGAVMGTNYPGATGRV